MDKSISSVFPFINNPFIFLFVLLFLAISIIYIKYKAKSAFSLSNKFWHFWTHYKKINNEENNKDLINDIIEIEKFNYLYNTHATSKRQKENFESWIRKYELDFKLISKLKDNLIIDSLKIKKIKKIKKILSTLLFFMFLFTTILFFTLPIAIKPSALIKIKDSNTGWFWINQKEATEYNLLKREENIWHITQKHCNENKIPTNMDSKTKNIICESFHDQDSLNFIDRLIIEQRWGFGIISMTIFIIIIYFYNFLIVLISTLKAREMVFLKLKKYRSNKNR